MVLVVSLQRSRLLYALPVIVVYANGYEEHELPDCCHRSLHNSIWEQPVQEACYFSEVTCDKKRLGR